MTMKLLDLYTSMLDLAKVRVTEDGFLEMIALGEKKPASIKTKRIVLPTREHLAALDWENRIKFHPLNENVLRGESEVLTWYRKSLAIRTNLTIAVIANRLLQLATSPAEHSKLSPEQAEFLSKVKNADEKTLDVLIKIMEAFPATDSFVSIFLKRAGQVNGRRYARVGVVTFPVYQALKSGGDVKGVKMRVKDRESLIALLEYMLPSIGGGEENYRGSDSQIAPFCDALMKSMLVVAAPLNAIMELFHNQFEEEDYKSCIFNDEWVEAFDNLALMKDQIRAIPMQAGNEGGVAGVDGASVNEATPAAAPMPAPVAAAPAHPTPAPGSMHAQIYGTPAGAVPGAHQPQPAPYHQPQPPGYYPPYPHGQPQAPYQGYPQQQMPPPQPVVRHTSGGVDFNSLMRANGHLAAQVGSIGQPQPMMAQQQRQPSWASPAQQAYGPGAGYHPGGGYRSSI